MNRRDFLLIGTAAAAAELQRRTGTATAAEEVQPFDPSRVRALTRELAAKPYRPPDTKLPHGFGVIGYDQYRSIRFLPERSLWRGERLPFELQLFHRGFLFANRVPIYIVVQGRAEPVRYSPDLFTFDKLKSPALDADLDFAGFRIHAPINRPDYYDEVSAFLGASYFRAVARNQRYGLSARGLAIRTADNRGEEFPYFTNFWIERPGATASSLVVHAQLDSPSATAAYRFTIRPGDTTIFDVELALFPRVDVAEVGIAPLTSMFYFGPNDRNEVDDYRPAVHDSDGLAIRNGRGELIWRPLSNPRDLQISTFADANPRGFGLMQRQRNFAVYEDLEARYEKRPSLWVEPIGDWGEGSIHLVEIPTRNEYHDNIVAFWRPKEPVRARGEYLLTYRLHWGAGIPDASPLAQPIRTSIGAGPEDSRLIVIDFTAGVLKSASSPVRASVSADKGELRNIVTQPNPVTGGWRVAFQLRPQGETLVELRAQLHQGEEVASETWVYRWTN